MTQTQSYLAFDLGAGSGRAMLGQLDGGRLFVSEIHRFPNNPVLLPDGYHWDVLNLWQNIKDGMRLAAREYKVQPASLALDTWGVDFALLDKRGDLIGNPYYYMDLRTEGMLEEAFKCVPRSEIFAETGVQFIRFNTLYQLLASVLQGSPALEMAHTFLMLPDLFNYWFSGARVCEFTEATTSQCMNITRMDWARGILEKMGIPTHIFPPIVKPGSVLGRLRPEIAEDTGLGGVTVVAPACHDTGSAVAAVPAEKSAFAWISSGTWSIMGVEIKDPIIDARSEAANLANEGGVNDTFRLSKNVAAMWLIQQCKSAWAREGETLSYAAITEMAEGSAPLRSIINPDAGDFMAPGDMPARIREYCRKRSQPVPETKGEVVRCALEGIALKYRWILEQLESVLGYRLEPIHIVGGGTQNRLLSQLAADATDRLVVTGPVEATATGNILMQAMALGHIGSVAEGRELVRRSAPLATYEPRHSARWDDAYAALLRQL